ncbi:MAG: AAA family ATPase [Planctomycetaceae bacterium]|nr:AAA family ATPase [Planctomycetaceae bacterium]
MPVDPFESLREALKHSPDNVPLRQHLAEALLERGRAAEAEQEFRAALQLAPHHSPLQLGLARAFHSQGKSSEAIVVLEEMLKGREMPGAAYVLLARLLYREGDVPRSVAMYKAGIDDDPDCGDEEFEQRLGIVRDPEGAAQADVVEGRQRAGTEPTSDIPVEIERPKIDFSSVGGMESLKEEIRLKIIYPLQQQDLYKAYGKSIGGGLLMYGPPGCGKTHLARATAGEIKAGFVSVGINDVLDMWIGQSERNLHSIFEQCREDRPCVLFFDEVDALGARRSDMRQSAGRHLINQFLSEMDGATSNNEGLLILAATNAPWHLDPAFRRPGRFDRILFVPPPDETAREEILQLLCEGKPMEDIDYYAVVRKTKDFSGADLKAVVDRAVEAKLQEAMKAGSLKPITTRDLLQAAKLHRPTTQEWFSTARNHALYANEGGIYDDILKYLRL